MSYLRSEHERAAYRRVYYVGTNVYVNKLGIRGTAELEKVERELTAERAEQGFPRRATFRTYDGYRAIHRHLFRDLYSWATRRFEWVRQKNWATGWVSEWDSAGSDGS